MTLTEIKEEIPKLTLAEQMELAEMLHASFDEEEDEFDKAIRADMSAQGPLWQMGQRALEEFKRGETLPGFP